MIHVRVQGHPARRHLHQALVEAIGLPAEVMLHKSDPPNPWKGYQQCLSDLPECTHLLLVQDDVRVCKGFVETVEKVASEVPTCLFLARLPRDVSRQATFALKQNRRYVTWIPRSFVPVVAILWPIQKAEEFMAWTKIKRRMAGRYEPRSDDAMVGLWGAITRQEFRATVPSLVEHPDMEPSLIGRRASWGKDSGRVAQHFCEDGLLFDW
jgi:hypothetical protein